jgi:hypothetical protein
MVNAACDVCERPLSDVAGGGLGFNDSSGSTCHGEEIVGFTVWQRKLANCYAFGGIAIERVLVLERLARGGEQCVNVLPRELFWRECGQICTLR